MRRTRTVAALAIAVVVMCAVGCGAKSPVEKAGSAVDHAARDTGHAVEHAVEKTGDAIEKGADKVEDAVK